MLVRTRDSSGHGTQRPPRQHGVPRQAAVPRSQLVMLVQRARMVPAATLGGRGLAGAGRRLRALARAGRRLRVLAGKVVAVVVAKTDGRVVTGTIRSGESQLWRMLTRNGNGLHDGRSVVQHRPQYGNLGNGFVLLSSCRQGLVSCSSCVASFLRLGSVDAAPFVSAVAKQKCAVALGQYYFSVDVMAIDVEAEFFFVIAVFLVVYEPAYRQDGHHEARAR